ncbi:TM2 domain-containing protein [Deinococcus budaensis]|uniref:TM2 domain-containing membrane protein YozV n=1 Tax=Deinococcus budaensis TaxID=1665626 RepID=A0A7W8LPN2_9DEIO|nr:TM2 domain-containing protein [Deinococcus budaensis]MBB5233720.1 TM2 domain-containing membrane protein YozV [Deinococcus budaensis]
MTRDDRSDDPPQGPPPDQRPPTRPEVPSWVDEVLSAQSNPPPTAPSAPAPVPDITVASVDPAAVARPASSPPSGSSDLRIPETQAAQPRPTPLTPPDRTAPPQPAPRPAAQTAPTLLDSADDWIARATGGAARSPSMPGSSAPSAASPSPSPLQTEAVTHAPVPTRPPDPWALGQSAASGPVPGDIATRRLIAGLLAIVLGSFGVHKLYLGITTPGLIMLAVNVGVWIVALLLGLITFGIGLVVTLPLAGLVSGALGLLGLVEGILYLTKSDSDFYQQYVVEKKPWL